MSLVHSIPRLPRFLVLVLGATCACSNMPSLEAGDRGAAAWPPLEPTRRTNEAAEIARAAQITCLRDTKIAPWQELLVVEPEVLAPRESDTPWAFASVMRAAAGYDAGVIVTNWLRSLDNPNGGPQLQDPGVRSIHSEVLCPWKRAYEGNECDESCARCKYETLRMDDAPFVPIAVVNRGDLAATASGCVPSRGEGRIIYNAVDPATHVALPFTLSFEFALGDEGTHAGDWHAIGEQADAQGKRRALSSVVAGFATSKSLLRVRTGESVRAGNQGAWHMRDFAWGSDGFDVQRLVDTPPNELWNTDALSVLMNRRKGLSNNIPPHQLAWVSIIPTPAFTWAAPRQTTEQERAFSQNTCNGCHGGDRPYDGLSFRHLMLDERGTTSVSRFLFDQKDPTAGDLHRRAERMREALCGVCSGHPGGYHH